MAKNIYLEIYDKYKFLHDYGFTYSIDNDSHKPCFKNNFGKIIINPKQKPLLGYELDFIIVSSSGTRTINVEDEYKRIVRKSPFFKRTHVIFKELFIYVLNNTKSFFELRVYNNNNYLFDIIDVDLEKEAFEKCKNLPLFPNVTDERKITNIVIFTTVLFFINIILFIANSIIENYQVYFIILNIVAFISLLISLIVIIGLSKIMTFISKFLIFNYSVFVILSLYLFNDRLKSIINFLFLGILFIYLIASLIYFLISKKKNHLGCSLVSLIFPIFNSLSILGDYQDYIKNINDDFGVFFLIGLVLGVIFVIVYIILVKKQDNKEYFGFMAALFFGSIFLLFLPYFIKAQINYMFDESTGVVEEYKIIKKRISPGGYRSGPRYYITININGKEEEIKVSNLFYSNYDINDTIKLSYHDGYLDEEYYEIIDENMWWRYEK